MRSGRELGAGLSLIALLVKRAPSETTVMPENETATACFSGHLFGLR
jgi:hypothetical protein